MRDIVVEFEQAYENTRYNRLQRLVQYNKPETRLRQDNFLILGDTESRVAASVLRFSAMGGFVIRKRPATETIQSKIEQQQKSYCGLK